MVKTSRTKKAEFDVQRNIETNEMLIESNVISHVGTQHSTTRSLATRNQSIIKSTVEALDDETKATNFGSVAGTSVKVSHAGWTTTITSGDSTKATKIKSIQNSLSHVNAGSGGKYRITIDGSKAFPFAPTATVDNGVEQTLNEVVVVPKKKSWAVQVSAASVALSNAAVTTDFVKTIKLG